MSLAFPRNMPHINSASDQKSQAVSITLKKKKDIWDIICDLALVASGMHFVIPHEPKLQNHHQ